MSAAPHTPKQSSLSVQTLVSPEPLWINPEGEYGEVFTRSWVAEMILDLVGYDPNEDLALRTVVEPACGTGAFLGPLVQRLSASCKLHNRELGDAADALRAFDLLPRNVTASRNVVKAVLLQDGWSVEDVDLICGKWIEVADYLLRPQQIEEADLVVGNPPYIRLEDVADDRMQAYRHVCRTMTGRSDVYIGFFERALRSLKKEGSVAFICADRWMRNQYGRRLRAFISQSYSVDATIAMHDANAFEVQVSAYPAVILLSRRQQGSAFVVDTNSSFRPADARSIVRHYNDGTSCTRQEGSYELSRLPHWFSGETSWPSGTPSRLALIEELTDRFPPLEDPATQTTVGIGLASGADHVYITTNEELVESDRLLPLALVRDIRSGKVEWSGNYLVNPWNKDGLINLDEYPRLARYYQDNSAALRKRSVAKRRPAEWYRTIDRVKPGLKNAPKLLIPDLRMQLYPVLDAGQTYPHQNLYHIQSGVWDLQVLGGLLLSSVANAFVEAFAVKMRGGTLRFQAQYLRRIRLPRVESISESDAILLRGAFENRDAETASEVALRLYGLDSLVK